MKLITFSEFEDRMPGVRRRTLERLSGKTFPPFVRLSERGEPFWNSDAVERWLSDKLAAIAEGSAA